jgi:hypothetical protein
MAMFSVFSSLARVRCGQKTAHAAPARMGATASVAIALLAGTGAAHADEIDRTRLSNAGPGSLRVEGSPWGARFDLRAPVTGEGGATLRRSGWQLLGDYHFRTIGGLRATGGLLGSSTRPAALAPNLPAASRMQMRRGSHQGLGEMAASGRLWQGESEASTATYLGLGYSVGNPAAGWGLSADLGLRASRETTEVRLGQGDNTSADWPQTLRLRPMLQFGVSYSF